jgi:uncharacterized iron-regulated membrane protein
MANVFGMPYRIFVCALGLLIAPLSNTGVNIWWRKRQARKRATPKQLTGGTVADREGPVGYPPFGRLELTLVIAVLCPMSAKDLLSYHAARRHRPGDPGQIEEMADVDVLGCDVTTPGSAG